MIELDTYRLTIERPVFTEKDGHDFRIEKLIERQKQVIDFLKAQSEAYSKANEDKAGRLGGGNDSHLHIHAEDECSRVLTIRSVGEFRDFIAAQKNPLIKALEASSGFQFMVFAGFIETPQYSTDYNGISRLNAGEFNRVSFGISPGKALTEGEKEARVKMNDLVFEKISNELGYLKKQFPDYVIEAQEKKLGSVFVRVTSRENKEGGVRHYNVMSAMGGLSRDRENVAGVFSGPELYPSDVEALREEAKSKESKERKPKGLSL